MFSTGISNNGIIVINKGDTFYAPLFINIGDECTPERYILTEDDTVYFAICEPNQVFERGVIRKIYTANNLNEDGDVEIILNPEDTENILPGTYYYEIKLRVVRGDQEIVDTIVPRRKFVIC